MKPAYQDILDRLGAPLWWDEAEVPRYDSFSPELLHYPASSAALILISCQWCEEKFQVALSDTEKDLVQAARSRTLRYGDPPDTDCCSVGPTMNSIPLRVLQFWQRDQDGAWRREGALEQELDCSWAEPSHNRAAAKRLLEEIGESSE